MTHWQKRVSVSIRPQLFAYNLAHLLLERVFHRSTFVSIDFKPCFSSTIHVFLGPITVPVLNELAQWAAGGLPSVSCSYPRAANNNYTHKRWQSIKIYSTLPKELQMCPQLNFPSLGPPNASATQPHSTRKEDGRGFRIQRNSAINPLWLKYLTFCKILQKHMTMGTQFQSISQTLEAEGPETDFITFWVHLPQCWHSSPQFTSLSQGVS